MTAWITEGVDLALPAAVVLRILQRADRCRGSAGGRVEREGTALTIWPDGREGGPVARAAFAWRDLPGGQRTAWRLARVAWDAEGGGEAAAWAALDALAGRPLRGDAAWLVRELDALGAADFREGTRRFLGRALQGQLRRAGQAKMAESGREAAGRLALELAWGLIDEAAATRAWRLFLGRACARVAAGAARIG